MITVATRLPVGLQDVWGSATVTLPAGSWKDLLTGRSSSGGVPLRELLADYPVALLVTG